MKRANLLAMSVFFIGASFSSLSVAEEKGALKTTTIEVGYNRINTSASNLQAAMSMRLRNETEDGWYVDLSGIDNDFEYLNSQGVNTSVDYWANARLGKNYAVSDKLTLLAGADVTFVKLTNNSRGVQEGVGGHLGLEYQLLSNLRVESDVAYLEWADESTLQLSLAANVKLHKKGYMAMRLKDLIDVDIQTLEVVVGVEF